MDIVVTTALIPGKKAPLLWTEDMVKSMRAGSVVVDLAASQGGNCACTVPEEAVTAHGVTVIGYTDLTSRLATHASQFFGTNLWHLLSDMGGAEGFQIDLEDEVVRKSLVLHEGRVTWPPPPDPEKPAASPPAPAPAPAPQEAAASTSAPDAAAAKKGGSGPVVGLALAAIFAVIGLFAPADFIQHFTVFVLACFVGWQVIWNVAPALHTPLMSVTNAISGIICGWPVAGCDPEVGCRHPWRGGRPGRHHRHLGGFLVTRRMLAMFRKED